MALSRLDNDRGEEEEEREDARRDLERLIWQSYGKDPPSTPQQVQLLQTLRLQQLQACPSQGCGGLYLAVLSLQAMLLSSWAECLPAYRLPKEAFLALIGKLSHITP